MKKILFISFLFIFHNLFSQQVIEKCFDQNLTFTYSSESSVGGSIIWNLNNQSFVSNDLMVNWSDYPLGNYEIIAYQNGLFCPSDTVYFTVELLECPTSSMWAPNSFTPNGDEYNNVWRPVGYNYFREHFFIVNRWGEIIFESNNLSYGWDGTHNGSMCQDGVYIYVLEWWDIFRKYHRVYGHITLLR